MRVDEKEIDPRSSLVKRGGYSVPPINFNGGWHQTPLSSIGVCSEIGKIFKDPEKVLGIIDSEIQQGRSVSGGRQDLSLAYGFPGIALMTTMLGKVFPTEEWEFTTNTYLRLTLERLEKEGSPGPSLFLGTAGICLAIHFASKEGTLYQKLLGQMEDLLVEEIHREFLTPIEKHLGCVSQGNISPGLYNLMEGITGPLAYLSLRTDNKWLRKISIKLLEALVQLMNVDKVIGENRIPSWYIAQEDQLTFEEKEKNPRGSFNITMPYGITGLLAILSIFTIKGETVTGQCELIQKIADWLKENSKNTNFGPCWEHTVYFEPEIEANEKPRGLTRDAWCYGVPSIARSLFLAAQALKDPMLRQFSEESYLKVFQKPEKEWNLIGTSFSYGRAGFLAIAHQMAEDTANPFLKHQCELQEKDLLRFYDAKHPFGFQMVTIKEDGQYMWINNPGLLDGVAGIVTILLQRQLGRKCNWGRAFLLS